MKVFVTGSSGLLGTNLILELLKQGFSVKGLIRNLSSYQEIPQDNLELIQGNIFDDLRPFLVKCDFVIHVAAETDQDLLKYHQYEKINVYGTLNLLEAAIDVGVRKFIYVSSANTIGYSGFSDGEMENIPIKFPFTKSFYALSKLQAEIALLAKMKEIDVVIANPTFMLGAYDVKPTSGKIILMAINRKFVFHPPGGKNFVHVNDVAKGLIQCLHYGRNGEKYIFSGENLTYRDFFLLLSKQTGKKLTLIQIPQIFLKPLGLLGDIIRKFGIKTRFQSVNMHSLCINNYYDNYKSRQEFDMKYRPVEEAIKDSLTFLVKRKIGIQKFS